MRAAMTFVLAIMVSLATLFIAGEACDNVPSMTWTDACNKACGKQPWYKLCPETLQGAPDTAEVTVYELIVVTLAKLKYEDTMAKIDQMLADTTLPAGEREAVDQCKVKYGEARGLIVSIANQLFGCDFTRSKQEYLDAQAAIVACQNGLWPFLGSSLVAMVSANLDLTMVAYELDGLIVGR